MLLRGSVTLAANQNKVEKQTNKQTGDQINEAVVQTASHYIFTTTVANGTGRDLNQFSYKDMFPSLNINQRIQAE